jgi:tetratricopeptide (TPR) repeat protein
VGLGNIYFSQGKASQAREAHQKAFSVTSDNAWAYVGLGNSFFCQGNLAESEAAYIKALKFDAQNATALCQLGSIYLKQGDKKKAEQYFRKIEVTDGNSSFFGIPAYYRRLKSVLDSRGIRLVFVQHPMRGILPLSEILRGEQGVIFVDNEPFFREAVKKSGYQRYFKDSFGDSGYCTAEGSRLLAQNIATTIMRQLNQQ